MPFLDKLIPNAARLFHLPSPADAQPTSATFNRNFAENQQNNAILKSVAANIAANDSSADGQTDSAAVFKQEVAQVNEQNLSKVSDRSVRVVFSKPAEQMSYDDYTRDYLRAMLRETGVSSASDAEVDRFQSLLKDASGDNFGVEDKAQQAAITTRYRAAQSANGNEATWGTSERGRALVLAGAGAIVRERAATGATLGTAQTVGQEKAMEMARDVPRVLYNAGVNAVEGTTNAMIDAVASDMGRNPFYLLQTNKPHADLSAAKGKYESELMKRDAGGKVTDDANAITAGKVIEKGVEIGGSIVAGKVLSAPEASQGLNISKSAENATEATQTANQTTKAATTVDDASVVAQAKATTAAEVGNVQVINQSELNITHGLTSSKKAFARLKDDIAQNGIKDPIKFVTYNGRKFVVDGHHRLVAARQLGIKEVPAQEVKLPYLGYKNVDDLFSDVPW